MKKDLSALKPTYSLVAPILFLSLILGLFLSFPPSSVQAQGCGVQGRVTNSAGDPIPNAGIGIHRVMLDGTFHFLQGTMTGINGSYSVSGLPCGVELILFVICTGPLDSGHRFVIPSGTITINRTRECMIGPVPGPGPGPGLPTINFRCDNSARERVSRPDECDLCNQTNLFCPACATSFTVYDQVKYVREDDDYWCNDQPWLTREWGGNITIDIDGLTMPFVGKNEQEDESKYLADYFEGTNEYYRDYPLRLGSKILAYGVNPILTTNYQGILRKLTPMEYQNQLKEGMVRSVITSQGVSGTSSFDGAVHDYQLNYIGRFCWDTPLWLDAILALLNNIDLPGVRADWALKITHYCLFSAAPGSFFDDLAIEAAKVALNNPLIKPLISSWEEKGIRGRASELDSHFPPDPNDYDNSGDYLKDWREWRDSGNPEGKWYRLWQVTPMVSREDTPGWIMPYLGARANDTFTIQNPSSQVEKVPHVARLQEASQEIQKMLFPYIGDVLAQEKKGPIIASPAVCGLDDPLPVPPCGGPAISDTNDNDTLCCEDINITLSAEDHFINQCHEECIYGEICGPDPVCDAPDCPDYVFAAKQPNQSYTLASQPAGQNQTLASSSLAAAGDPCTYCETCPGGTHECSGITQEDGSCAYAGSCTSCQPCGNGTCDVCEGWDWCPDCEEPVTCHWGILNPCCKKEETQPVSREVGINLLHPYLTNIWDQTANKVTSGVFNIFRPEEKPEFVDIDAYEEISYRYQDTSDPTGGYLSPGTGLFYFNHLGGVQLAKDWVVRTLYPY